MDVHLLSSLLKELIIDNDRIPLSGIGYFTTEPMPAYFSEDGKTIYPPSRKISFKGDDRASGDLLADYYARKSGIDLQTASTEIDAFLKQLKVTLHDRKNIDIPGLGKLRCTLEGDPYFVTESRGGIFSQAFGFEPVILKPVRTSTAADTSAGTPAPENGCAEQDTHAKAKGNDRRSRTWIIVLAILAIMTVAAVILVTLGRGGYLDSLIYSDEELELIRQMENNG